MELLELLFLLTGVFFSFGAISYFFLGNNIWFSTAEHIGLGANAAIILSGDFRSLFPNCFDQVATGRISLLIPLIIGLLAFTRWTRFRWSARYPTAVLSGIGVGLMVGLQVRSSIVSMVVETVYDAVQGRPDPISGIIILIAMISVITYYLYGTRVSTPLREGTLKAIPKIGTYFLLVTAGYLYSNIYMFEGIDLASGFFIMRFKRVWEEITLYIGRGVSATAQSLSDVNAIPGISLEVTGLAIGAIAATAVGSYVLISYRQRHNVSKN